MTAAVSTQKKEQPGAAPNIRSVRALLALKQFINKCYNSITYCCRKRRDAAASSDAQAAARYFSNSSVAEDNAVEAAINAASAADKAAIVALETVAAKTQSARKPNVQVNDFTVIELDRSKSV